MAQKKSKDDQVIRIRGARVHNLKNVNVDIPRNKFVVITGVSGSGKSSLAFDTLYADGQRRYVESLSAYARQFLGMMEKPDVDSIDGISPAIAIDQKSVSKNPRSTVGTVTEIYDYLRLLFARAGTAHCYVCGRTVSRQSPQQIVKQLLKMKAGTHIDILAPMVRDRKGEYKSIIVEVGLAGFRRIRIDGELTTTDAAQDMELDRYKRHAIEVVVDRLEIEKNADGKLRLSSSVETALKVGNGIMIAMVTDGKTTEDVLFSESLACEDDGISLPELEPRVFSFNSPYGACPVCTGIGHTLEVDPKLVIPNPDLTLAEGAIKPWMGASHKLGRQSWYWLMLSDLADALGFSLNTRWRDLKKQELRAILEGSAEHDFEGVMENLKRRWRESDSDWTRAEIEKYMLVQQCPTCEGKRLRPEALAVTVAGKHIDELTSISVDAAHTFFSKEMFSGKAVKLTDAQKKIAKPIIKEVAHRLTFLMNVGLGYLTLDRASTTLAGGEAQRIRLATQIGTRLVGVLYILDEPSIGLHARDQARLIETLRELEELGNTVVVVEHDDQTIRAADWVIDVGPGAGKHGGKIIFEGTPAQLLHAKTPTGDYFSGRKKVSASKTEARKRHGTQEIADRTFGRLRIKGANEHNLKNIDVDIPLGEFVCVTGVSGSGKSTLVNDILGRALMQYFYDSKAQPGEHKKITGLEQLDKAIMIDQSPIGRTPRSNPATYTGAFGHIRDLFAETREAKVRGYKPGRFSFNVKGGRCETCQGDGQRKIEMQFLPDMWVECEECHGKRYNNDTLEIEWQGSSISDVLEMTVEEALTVFGDIPTIARKLRTLNDVGLGYIQLGQPATTLSGGEAQRIKLATELSKTPKGQTLYLLDEPTTGLHFADIEKLLGILHGLVAKGHSVLVIEHNLDVIRNADWVIDLGPEGGDGGGFIVAQGTPQDIKKVAKSITGQFLKNPKRK